MRLNTIDRIASPDHPGYVRLLGEVQYDTPGYKSEIYWFEVPATYADFLSTSGNPWVACLLPLAVTLKEPLHIDGLVDKTLYHNLQTLMHIWKSWYQNLGIVPIEAELVDQLKFSGMGKTASFFSGGVDAFFTVLKNEDPLERQHNMQIDYLIHVWGFDIPITDSGSYKRMLPIIQESADALGKKLLTVATNMRKSRLNQTGWGPLYH